MPYRPLFEAAGVRYIGADLPGNEMARVRIFPDGRVDLPDGSCDLVLSTQVLEHVADPRVYLAECHRLLRPGGRIIVSTHGYWWYHPDPADYWRWTGDGLRQQIALAGFSIVSSCGVVGLAGVGLQLFQDAVYPRLFRPLRAPFALLMQSLVLAFNRLHDDQDRRHDSLVFVVVGQKIGPVAT
jgi:SAM-dependent methyltransferase